MRVHGLEVCDSLESLVAWLPQRVRPDTSLGVVWNVLTGVAQMLQICLWRRGERRAPLRGVLVRRELNGYKVAPGCRSKELCVTECPFRTE